LWTKQFNGGHFLSAVVENVTAGYTCCLQGANVHGQYQNQINDITSEPPCCVTSMYLDVTF